MILFIYGANGAGTEIYDLAQRIGKYSKIYLIDDFKEETEYYGTMRIKFSSCKEYMTEDSEFAVSVGEPKSRKMLLQKIKDCGYRMATLVDPSVIVSPTSIINKGCIVNAQSIISSKSILEENCYLGFHVIVGHDAHIKKNTVVCPMATVGGGSVIGEETFIGLNSSMKERVCLGDRVIVGMGSMLFRDVESECTVVGNPARVTKGNADHKVFNNN